MNKNNNNIKEQVEETKTDNHDIEKNIEVSEEAKGESEVQEIDYEDKYKRLYAEFDNFKKRTQKEKVEWIQMAGKEVILSMIDVLDDCLRAEEQLEKLDIDNKESIKKSTEGVQIVFNKLKSNLTQKGVKEIDTIDKEFDINLHEAVSEIEVSEKDKKGKVIAEVQRGYKLYDKVIKFSKVVVGK